MPMNITLKIVVLGLIYIIHWEYNYLHSGIKIPNDFNGKIPIIFSPSHPLKVPKIGKMSHFYNTGWCMVGAEFFFFVFFMLWNSC